MVDRVGVTDLVFLRGVVDLLGLCGTSELGVQCCANK